MTDSFCEAPTLIPTLLDGLIWRSARTDAGLRRVNFYVPCLHPCAKGGFWPRARADACAHAAMQVKHLLVNQERFPQLRG